MGVCDGSLDGIAVHTIPEANEEIVDDPRKVGGVRPVDFDVLQQRGDPAALIGRDAVPDKAPCRLPGDDSVVEKGLHVMADGRLPRSEEHTSELQSLMRISYAVFCLKKKT